MATQKELDKCYIQMTKTVAQLSKAVRKKVGCVLVTPENGMLAAYNGTPSGWDNCCEDVHVTDDPHFSPTEVLHTKDDVIHAELNAILHAARQGVSIKGSTIYISLSPCLKCSAMIAQAGIKRVVYAEEYRDLSGVSKLLEHGIIVEKYVDTN